MVYKISIFLFLLCPLQFEAPTQRMDGFIASSPALQIAPAQFAPNTCRVMGTIMAIDSTHHGRNGKDPCSDAPCLASVRIDSVLGYGPAFPRPLHKGLEIQVWFAFTLKPTKEINLNTAVPFPGLNVGSKFVADVNGHSYLRGELRDSVFFEIYDYHLR